jgi:LPXTG-motif cell wall-anchored protein
MSQISVYDIASTSWFVVTASGAAPLPRRQFCAVVSAAPDQSSFQVTIFGGFDGAETDFEDVWVLTIPSFNWINVGSKNDGEVSATVNIGRSHHRCAIYNDAQMIVLGGSVREGTPVPVNETSCKSLYPPIRVLDTTTYTWKTSFDDSLKYTVPESVTMVIGGNGEGGATMSGPEKGFNFTALSAIFATPLGAKATATNSASPTPTPAPTSHTGAIAGGVVAGVAGLAILAGAAYFFIRRKRKADEVKRNGWKSVEQARTGEPKYALVSGVKAEQTELPTYSRPPAELGENHRGGGLRSPIELSG